MGFFSSMFGRSGNQMPVQAEPQMPLPDLYNGMTLDMETPEGKRLLTGRLAGYQFGQTQLTLERLPGTFSLEIQEVGSTVVVRGISSSMAQFFLKGTIQESTRTACKLKDVRVKVIAEHRNNFRLQVGIPATMYYPSDQAMENPEQCVLVDISSSGACIESEFLHAEDEVLRLKVKLMDYAPMDFLGEIIRVLEYEPGKFRYGFLFAQLKESELTELTRTLYNIQVGNRQTWVRSPDGHW